MGSPGGSRETAVRWYMSLDSSGDFLPRGLAPGLQWLEQLDVS